MAIIPAMRSLGSGRRRPPLHRQFRARAQHCSVAVASRQALEATASVEVDAESWG